MTALEVKMNRTQRKYNKKEHIFSTRETINKNLHKIYLTLALFFGIIFSVGLPLFNEPDGVYHYVNSSNMVGLTNDVSAYGETRQWFGDQFAHQRENYQNGTFFEKYFETQVELMPIEKLPRSNKLPSIKSYDYWGHVIPAIGVWLGYHIYPSMGVMIVTARLFNMFVLSIGMFFVIKFVKKGKLLFTLISLSPVIVNTFSSLSYDGISFLLSAVIVAMAINMTVSKKIGPKQWVNMVLVSATMMLVGKTNLKILILLFLLVLFSVLFRKKALRIWKKLPLSLKLLPVPIILLIGILFTIPYGGVVHVGYKLVINNVYSFAAGNYSLFTSTLSMPLGSNNNPMPLYLSGVWAIFVVLVVLVEEKYVDNAWISWGAFMLFFLNMIALYMAFFTGYSSGRNEAMGQISGIQGRYITPTLLLFSLFASNSKFKIKLESYKTVVVASVVLVVFSNSVLLFNTLYQLYRF